MIDLTTSARPVRTSPGAANRNPAGANGGGTADGRASPRPERPGRRAGLTRRPARRRRGAAASHSATFSGQCRSSSARSHSSSGDVWLRHRTG